jgi:hypothetical protein
MTRRTGIVAFAMAAVLGTLADGAAAQEFNRGRSSRGSGGTRFVLGSEVWADHRGIIYDSIDFGFIAPEPAPPPPLTSWDDERLIEHDTVHSAGHVGGFFTFQVLIDGEIPVRLGVRLGSFIGMTRGNEDNPGAYREVTDVVTRPGFAGGILADVRVPLHQRVFLGGTLDFYVGQASVDNLNGGGIATVWEGSYFFLLPELSVRLGFTLPQAPVSPFIGVAASFFMLTVELEDPAAAAAGPGALETFDLEAGNWEFVRVIFGVELGEAPVQTRLQIALWNPSRDYGVSLMAIISL